MKLENTNALTEKGVLSAKVREAVKGADVTKIAEALADMGYEYVEKKNCFVKTRTAQDANIYTVLTLTVSTKHPTELSERKPKPKAKAETETIEIE